MAEGDVQELNERFASGDKALEADTMAELQSIMRMHSLSAQDLFFKWESYCIKMDMDDMELSVDTLRALKRDIQDALERDNRNHHLHIKTEKRAGGTPRAAARNGGDAMGFLIPNTPGTAKLSRAAAKRKLDTPSISRVTENVLSSSPDYKTPQPMKQKMDAMNPPTAPSFDHRHTAGEVVEVLNEHLKPAVPPIAPYGEARIKLTAASDQKKLAYKPLAMKTSEASEILDDRIEEFMALVMDHHKLDDAAFGNPAGQSTSDMYAVGRIASDSGEGKLNAASLVLETSRRTGAGLRVPLNLSNLRRGYHFFPGQIVAFRGTNSSGMEFTVQEVVDMPLLPNAASTPAMLASHRERLRGGPDAMDSDDEPAPLNVLFASGPYSADDNLDFAPLHALCSQAADTYADALILTGPFIDIDHPLIATGEFDLPDDAAVEPDTATMATVFKFMISPALNRLVGSNPNITILLIPSVRDVVDKHVSWPQDPFPRKELGLPKTARILGNPMTLSMNETIVGISSQDVLWELRHEELVVGKPTNGQLLSRLPSYLIEQRSFFPLFPPVDRRKLPKTGTVDGVPVGAMLDTSYLKLGDMVNVRPDVLVVPSSLPPFIKVVESVLVINPGYLSKRRGPGTYARMTLYPPKLGEEELPSSDVVAHKVFERARVEITRI